MSRNLRQCKKPVDKWIRLDDYLSNLTDADNKFEIHVYKYKSTGQLVGDVLTQI